MEFNPGLDVSQRVPEDTQYLNLLKTNFILGKLKGSIRFQEAGPSSLWVDYMKELEKVKSSLIASFWISLKAKKFIL